MEVLWDVPAVRVMAITAATLCALDRLAEALRPWEAFGHWPDTAEAEPPGREG